MITQPLLSHAGLPTFEILSLNPNILLKSGQNIFYREFSPEHFLLNYFLEKKKKKDIDEDIHKKLILGHFNRIFHHFTRRQGRRLFICYSWGHT